MEEHPVAPFNASTAMERFNALYARHAGSPTHRAIFREIYGADYSEEAVSLSYISMTLLRFANWDRDLSPPHTPPPVNDHRPLLHEAGFAIETYKAIPEAEQQRRAIYEWRFVSA